jgi:hypothetical protein
MYLLNLLNLKFQIIGLNHLFLRFLKYHLNQLNHLFLSFDLILSYPQHLLNLKYQLNLKFLK